MHLIRGVFGVAGRRAWAVGALVIAGIVQMAFVPVQPAYAAPSASARAASLAAEISAQSVQVHRVNVAYQSALVTVGSLKVKTAAAQRSVATTSREVSGLRATLRQEAVDAFVQVGAEPSQFMDTLDSNPSSYEVGQVYLEATSGQVTDGLAQYKRAEANYRSQDAILTSELSRANEAAASLASQDQSLRATLDSESVTLSQVRQLAAQVVADQAPPGAPAPQGLPTQRGLAALAASPPPVALPPVVDSSLPPSPSSTAAPVALGSSAPPAATVSPSLDFEALAQCESGGDYSTNTGNGYYGAFQFSASTWANLGFSGLPSNASPSTQVQAAEKLQAQSGWGQWPSCAAALGLT